MSARPFATVLVCLPGQEPRQVANTFEALECLTGAWPISTGRPYRLALQACRDALDGYCTAARARTRFVAAARDVGVLAGEQGKAATVAGVAALRGRKEARPRTAREGASA